MKDLKSTAFYNSAVLPYHLAKTVAVGAKYKWPGKRLRVIGVTGTNGKTTTCFMIWKMLQTAGRRVGLMTTVGWGVDTIESQIEHMTTVDVVTLNKRMQKIADQGAEFLVLEVTSHALAQFRTLGVPIDIAVMTNVTHDHLDYHRTFERYVEAKCKLFRGAKFGIINADDLSAANFMAAIIEGDSNADNGIDKKYITYSIKRKADFMATDITLKPTGVNYSLGDINNQTKLNIKTRIPGEFNIYNSMAAACVGKRLGLTPKEIQLGIFSLENIEGRMNRIDAGQKFEVIVDYAHTPDAFIKVFSSIAPAYFGTKKERDKKRAAGANVGRIITVTGGAGRRDESTREERGKIAATYSDIFIVTEDDSRDEDPEKIAEAFAAGAEKMGLERDKSLFIEPDRKKAIKLAISMAKAKDTVLLLGKGHEKTILRADGAHPFEDLKVAKSILKSLQK